MTKTTTILWLAAAFVLAAAAPSGAQTPPTEQAPPQTQTPPPPPPPQTPPAKAETPKTPSPPPSKNFFVDVNGGVQAGSHSFTVTQTPTIYDETATITSNQKSGSGGLFDIGVGYRVWHDLAIAVGFTTTSSKADGAVTATIPDPAVTDQPKTTNLTVSGLKHSERAVNVSLVWSSPISDKMDAAVALGPSFVHVSQDLAGVTVPAGTSDAVAGTPNSQSKSAVGFHIGGDVTYLFQPRVGIGVMARYLIAKTDLPAVSGLTLGGFQVGGGVRLRF